jgi:alpha-1,3/alpha-1,6-mannosyltransferase
VGGRGAAGDPRGWVLNVAFLHPDLGLGGAERLVVDAATWLRAAGHGVVVLTAHHDPGRAFPATTDGTLDVRVHGRALPPQVLGRLRAPCAVARMAWLARAAGRLVPPPDVVFVDLVAHAIPVLRWASPARVVFFCHFPDRLLVPARRGLYAWYRLPIDALEERATGMADRVLVNSRFTAARFHDAFPSLRAVVPEVVHPGVAPIPTPDLAPDPPPGPFGVLSLARLVPDKRLELALEALGALRARLAPADFARVRLVMAGAFDARFGEQRATRAALDGLARRLGLAAQVVLRPSPTEAERRALLSECRCVVYTPADEHFGYVPVEAMAAGRPVVAVDRGGPAETVVHGETGFLCAPEPAAFADALATLVREPATAARMGRAGRAHAAARFSPAAFGARIEAVLAEVVG